MRAIMLPVEGREEVTVSGVRKRNIVPGRGECKCVPGGNSLASWKSERVYLHVRKL